MYLVIATLFVTNYLSYRMDLDKIKQIFNYFVFVLSKTLVVENRQYILQYHGRIIEISGELMAG